MNNSGLSALDIKSFYKIKNEDIYVFHDEIDLDSSKIKIKKAGSNNGHNGLKSLDHYIGKDYHRVRIGIGRPKQNDKKQRDEIISKWVLSNFTSKDRELWLNSTIDNITRYFEELIEKNFSKFLLKICDQEKDFGL